MLALIVLRVPIGIAMMTAGVTGFGALVGVQPLLYLPGGIV